MRADARRNRDKVLAAAEVVFGEKGTSASTEDVAREAGLGIGTVFRHFPTKEALLEAVLVGRLQRAAEELDSLATSDDPGAALFEFFTRTIEQARLKSALADALTGVGVDVGQSSSAVAEHLRRALTSLLGRAQEARAVRTDIGVTELIALLVGTTRAAEHAKWQPDVHARILAVVLDGLVPKT